ncbi:methanogen marker protein 4 [Methanocaldococcus villosus KIN24-T80]|uniref:Methanogen marker protein 4 n=1 Tax=Methanocaldococcus villosus KIN24-T80 TaxID=1069083 RepID=N6VYA9_9EURY|nr:methanogenesis marker protein Mmp4/MtxX [Methanocaldococcus villosus]ENN96097.1 methanogen marker protein 4 [Methanocaldococcus villosus KIN24-T80]
MIGIGLGKNKEEVIKAYNKLKEENIEVVLIEDYKTLIDKLLNKELSGAIRGSLPSSEVIPYLREKIGKFYRASILKNPFNNKLFLLSPVGIDDISIDKKERIDDKIRIIKYASNLLKKYEIEPKIGLLSGGRLEDRGRNIIVDETIEEAEEIKKNLKEYNILHYGILIERYLKEDCNIIVAIDGITGNLIFRSLALVAGLEGYGAILLSNKEIKFIDTSREANWKRYYNAVKFLLGEFI